MTPSIARQAAQCGAAKIISLRKNTVGWIARCATRTATGASSNLSAGLALVAMMGVTGLSQANAANLETTFSRHASGASATVDHGAWTTLLAKYVVPGADGVNLVDYAKLKADGHAALDAYIASLEAIDPAALDRPEQFAFWANLYNAKTVDIVLDAYPVPSIKNVSLGGTVLANFTGGPWKAKVVKVSGMELSLDDIEHGILRPIFKDPRIHYAANCASFGCPNLQTEAFTGAKLEAQLDAAAAAYINHPRGITVKAGKITASGIYNWYAVDFGGNDEGVLAHAKKYASPELAAKLGRIKTIAEYDYDWRLNDAKK